MLDQLGIFLRKFFVYIASILLLFTGFYITWGALSTDKGVADPKIFAPLGVIVIFTGVLLLISKE